MLFINKVNKVTRLAWRQDLLEATNKRTKLSFHVTLSEHHSNTSHFLKTNRWLNYYYFFNQAFEINNFKTNFKNPSNTGNPERIKITNKGEDIITIHSASTDNQYFPLKGFSESIELQANDELILDLLFKPSQYGFYSSKLVIETSMKNHERIEFDLFGVRKKGKSYYRIINGVRYDRLLLEIAYSVMMQNSKKQIDYEEIRIITKNVWDASTITETEKRSLIYIWDNYSWSSNARKWFEIGYSWVGIKEN